MWHPDEVPLTQKDRTDWEKLDEGDREFLKMWLAFFSQFDGLVIENIETNFHHEVSSHFKEASHFYAMQSLIETVHNEVYGLLIDTFIESTHEKEQMFNAIANIPSLTLIGEWAKKWMDDSRPLAERLIAFACIEGVLFSGAFAAIYWVKQSEEKILIGLTKANEWIARDEALHTQAAVLFYHKLDQTVSTNIGKSIITECIDVSSKFIEEAVGEGRIGLTRDQMVGYMKCTADELSKSLDFGPIYNQTNPLSWMVVITLPNKTNFFEDQVSEYSQGLKNARIEYTDDY